MSSFRIGSFLLLFLASTGISWALTFIPRHFAFRWGILAQPDNRRRHSKPTPLLGGMGIFLALFIGCLSTYFFWSESVPLSYALTLLLAIGLIFATGVADDCVELGAPSKFTAQIAASLLILAVDPALPALYAEFGVPTWVGHSLALLWMVGITNAMNLIDGMDGLCAGTASLAAGAVAVLFPSWGFDTILASVLAGATAGFLIHNFNPARIFLGDSGSLLIGFTLAALSLHLPFHGSPATMVGLLGFLFCLPVLDTALAIARRIANSKPIFEGDRRHLHHRLLNLGLSQRGVAAVLYSLQSYSILAAILISARGENPSGHYLALALPVVALFVAGLDVVEYVLCYQSTRLGFLFLGEELDQLSNIGRARSALRAQIEEHERTGESFSFVVIDFSAYIQHILSGGHSRWVSYYVHLYGALRARLRKNDFICQLHDLRLAILLPKTWEVTGQHAPLFDFLKSELKRLQQLHGVMLARKDEAAGMEILVYPHDRSRILSELGAGEPNTQPSHREIAA